MQDKIKIAGALALTTLLAACGGGGGGSTPATTSTSTGSTAPTSTNTGTTTTPQYPAGSQDLAAFTQLNNMRQQCGFNELSENTLIDQAALNHMNYMSANQYIGHSEVQGNTGFTGATPQARMTYAGYPAQSAGEVITASTTTDTGGSASVIALSSLPYHLAPMFYPVSDIGVSYKALNFGPSAPMYTLTMDFGNTASDAPTLNNTPLTFPCAGSTGVDYESARQESPSPYVNGQPVNTATNPIGTPITVIGNLSDTLRLTSGTIMDSVGNQVSLNVYDSSNDPNHDLPAFAGFGFPTSPLQPNTTYSVILNGTINGTSFSRNFSFTTGAQGQF